MGIGRFDFIFVGPGRGDDTKDGGGVDLSLTTYINPSTSLFG
jgi:hypothetical protein